MWRLFCSVAARPGKAFNEAFSKTDGATSLLQLLWKGRQVAPQLWGADAAFNNASERIYLEIDEMTNEQLALLSRHLSAYNVKASLVYHYLEKAVFERLLGDGVGLEQGVEIVFAHRDKLPSNAGVWSGVLLKNPQLSARGKLLLTVD